jgi:hypothetical protein
MRVVYLNVLHMCTVRSTSLCPGAATYCNKLVFLLIRKIQGLGVYVITLRMILDSWLLNLTHTKKKTLTKKNPAGSTPTATQYAYVNTTVFWVRHAMFRAVGSDMLMILHLGEHLGQFV